MCNDCRCAHAIFFFVLNITHLFSSVFCPGGCKDVAGEIWGQHGQGYRDVSPLFLKPYHLYEQNHY